jgi:hypothetical protein
MRALHIGAAHSVEKRNAIIAGHAHDHAIFEQAKSRSMGQGVVFGFQSIASR